MSPMPWFRVYSEVLHDRKLRKVCQLCKQPKAVVLGVWISLLAIASESPDRGRLLIGADLVLDLEDLAEETGLPIPELDAMMTTFQQLGMVSHDGEIINWGDRQFQSDNSTDRVRRWREKQRMERDETLQKRSTNVIDTDTESDTKKKRGRKRDPRLDHPAIVAYREEARLHVPVRWRDEVVSTVDNAKRWQELVHDWIGYGWNKQNIKGMLDAYQDGGIKARKTEPQAPKGYTAA